MSEILTPKQAQWLDHIQAAQASGLSFKDYAKQHKLDLKALYNWKSTFVGKGIISPPTPNKKSFVKVKMPSSAVATTQAASSKAVTVTLPSGVMLELPELTPETLRLLCSV